MNGFIRSPLLTGARMEHEISVVLPTYNRAPALRANLSFVLELVDVLEIVVVVDGSTDDTRAVLQGSRDERLRVIHRARNAGSPAARNLGAAVARGDVVVFAEDDCRFPPDYARVLRDEAELHAADVVGAPLLVAHHGEVEAELQAARARREGPKGLDDVAGFPPTAVETPLLPATALVRRRVLDALRFDEGYSGNAYREETDFFIRAAAHGFKCLLTPRTFFWEERRWDGGHARSFLSSEYWHVRNNWRFLNKHPTWLSERGYIDSPMREQAAFLWRRANKVLRAYLDERGWAT